MVVRQRSFTGIAIMISLFFSPVSLCFALVIERLLTKVLPLPFWLICPPMDILSTLLTMDGTPLITPPPPPLLPPMESILPRVMLLFLYSAVIFFHSSTLGTPARRTASSGSVTG